MKYEERIEKVKNIERDFLIELVSNILMFMKQDKNYIGLIKTFSGEDISNKQDLLEIYDIIELILPTVKKTDEMSKSIIEGLSSKNKHVIDMIVNDIYKKNLGFSKEQIYQGISNLETNRGYYNNFIIDSEFIGDLMAIGEIVSEMKDPVAVFKKIQKENSRIASILEKSKSDRGVDFSEIYKKFITEEFQELLSVKDLKIEKEECLRTERKSKNSSENFLFETANKKYKDISEEIDLLKNLGLDIMEIKYLLEIKTEYDGIFKMPFLKIDDDAIVEYAIDRLNELESATNQAKEKVYEWLVYHGQDIKDILREKHSYQIREYVEKLRVMSDKFDKQLSETSSKDIKVMLDFYRKIQSMYAVVDEMKQNSFVVDISRFSK